MGLYPVLVVVIPLNGRLSLLLKGLNLESFNFTLVIAVSGLVTPVVGLVFVN
jgi:hypothetical protein